MALFFSSLIAIYIGALIIAAISISVITVFCICAVLTAAGSAAFVWAIWQIVKKGANLLKGFSGVSYSKFP
ncbi:hypothetical protein KP509_26G020900 [Ceratopteris richardii]|nr:hypothetical protein KP509_26G020900 [Ceratopteris richardii]